MEKERQDKFGYQFIISDEDINKILNEKLRVIATSFDMKKDDAFRILEVVGNDFTGRVFYGRVIHVFSFLHMTPVPKFFQFELFGYADAADGERFSIAGDYPHEKKNFPEGSWGTAEFDFDGSRPAWFYEGIKWHSEVTIARLGFDALTHARPEDVILRVQGRNGERYFAYDGVVEVTEKFTAPLR